MSNEGFERIAAHVLARFPHAIRENASSIRFVAVFDGRRAGIRLRSLQAYGASVVMMTADLGLMDSLDPWTSLALNAQLAAGTLATIDGVLVLRALLRDETSTSVLDQRLGLLMREATTLKAQFTRAPRAADGFDCFCD